MDTLDWKGIYDTKNEFSEAKFCFQKYVFSVGVILITMGHHLVIINSLV